MDFNGRTYENIGQVYAAEFGLEEVPDLVTIYDEVKQAYDSRSIDVVVDEDEVLVHEAYLVRGEGRYVAREREVVRGVVD